MTKVKVYLVGGPEAHTTNRWEAMTNSMATAVERLSEIENGQIKTITVTNRDS
jgi:hypothetical protein